MLKNIDTIKFPEAQDLNVNMMPIILGDDDSIPGPLKAYKEIIHRCIPKERKKLSVAYLSIQESFLEKGKTQRRAGIHTESTKSLNWGGGGWGGGKDPIHEGIYMASSDGLCRFWNAAMNNFFISF
jgi:hypothetical protein